MGIYLLTTEPASTPNREERTRALAEPMNVYHMDFDFDAKSIVDNCVLSPSSARKTSKKAEKIDFHINTPPAHL
jgi:hypothetical protein